jgi:5'-3' exonuclease
MGIKGLFSLVKKFSQKRKIHDVIQGRKIGIDIFCFIHKSKGDIDLVKAMLNEYIESCETAIFVFDGKVSEERKHDLAVLKEKRSETLKIIKELEMDVEKLNRENADDAEKKVRLEEYINTLRIQSWAPKGNYVSRVKERICDWWPDKSRIVVAPYEADLYFGELLKCGQIDCIISNDSDMLALGYNDIMRPLDETEAGFTRTYQLQEILTGFKMDTKDWFDFIEICRKYNGNDIIIPYSYWRVGRPMK